MLSNTSGVYCIKNIENQKMYIGSSTNMRKREISHLNCLRKNKHHCKRLQNAFNKYSESAFIFEKLETTNNLEEREQYYFDNTDKELLYNSVFSAYCLRGEDHPMFNKKHSLDSILKIKKARSKQTIKHSKETKEKISKSNTGKKLSKKSIEKMKATKKKNNKSVWNKGLTIKDERVKKYVNKLVKKLDYDKIINEYNSGLSINYLASKYNSSWDAICNLLKRNGIKTRTISEQKRINDGVKNGEF